MTLSEQMEQLSDAVSALQVAVDNVKNMNEDVAMDIAGQTYEIEYLLADIRHEVFRVEQEQIKRRKDG